MISKHIVFRTSYPATKATPTRIPFEIYAIAFNRYASKLLRPHERFCVVFAYPHDNAENDGSVKSCLANQNQRYRWWSSCLRTGSNIVFKSPRFRQSTQKQSVHRSVHFQRRFRKSPFSVETSPPSYLLHMDGRLKRIKNYAFSYQIRIMVYSGNLILPVMGTTPSTKNGSQNISANHLP